MNLNPPNPIDREELLSRDDPDAELQAEKRRKMMPVTPVAPETMVEVYKAAITLVANHRDYIMPSWCWCTALEKQCPWCRLVEAVKADKKYLRGKRGE